MRAVLRNADLERLEITLTIPRRVRFRLWLGMKLMALGARITGCTLNVKQEQE